MGAPSRETLTLFMPKSSSGERAGRTGVSGWFSDAPMEEAEAIDDTEPGGTKAIGMTFTPSVPVEPVVWIEEWPSVKGSDRIDVR